MTAAISTLAASCLEQ